MGSISDTALQPPVDWQKFERECRSLWQRIWNDPNTQLNGRCGQPQAGVDVFGRQDGSGPWKGVQCKGRNAGYGSALTEDELREEVEKAKTFQPALSEYTVATTAPDDVKIQEAARLITEEHEKAGLFSVHVYGWDSIRQKLSQFAEVVDEHRPGSGPAAQKNLAITERVLERVDPLPDQMQTLLQEVQALRQQMASPVVSPALDPADALLNEVVDTYRDTMKSGQPRTALRLLEDFKTKRWATATATVRFRIETNIAAAKLMLGDTKGAAEGFLAAAVHKPGDEIGDCNIALAHHLLGNQAEFARTARLAATAHPASARAQSLAVAASCDDQAVRDPAALVPEAMLGDDEVLYAVAHWHRRRGDRAAYAAWMRKAYEADPEQMEVRASYAACLLESLVDDPAVVASGRLVGERRRRLDEAIRVLEEAWNEAKGGEAAAKWVELAVNLGTALRMSGNAEGAERVASEARLAVPDDAGLQRLSALLAMERSDWEGAARCLAALPEDSPADLRLIRAEALLRAGRHAEARDALDKLLASAEEREAILAARELRVHLAAATEGRQAAAAEAMDAADGGVEPLFFRALAADQFRLGGDEREAARTAIAAAADLSEGSSVRERVAVGDALRPLGRHAEAVAVYEPVVAFDADTPWLRRYLWCLLDLDQRVALRAAIDRLAPEVRALPEYRLIDAAYHERAGDLRAAAEKLNAYLRAEPRDFSARFSWISLLERLGDRTRLKAFLSRDMDLEGAPGRYLIRLAHVFDRNGLPEKALELGYYAVRTHPDEEDVCAGYVALLLLRRDERPGQPDEVGPDSAVTLADASGRQQTYVVEPGDILDARVEVSPDSDLAKRVVGLKAGETVVLAETDFHRDERTVAAIRHKMVYRLHEMMETFNTRFPGSRALIRVDVAGKDGTEFDFTPIFTSLDARQARVRDVEEMYRDGPLTLGLTAELLGVHPVEAWLGLATLGRASVKCCIGNAEERQHAFDVIARSGEGFVVDPVTLYAMHAFDIKAEVLGVAGRLAVARSSIDCLQELLDLRRMDAQDGRREMAKVGGQYVNHEVLKEEVEREARSIGALLEWVEGHCELLQAVGARELPPLGRRLADAMDRAFTDSMLAASGSARPLLSDDFRYRALAKRLLDVDGVWLQPLLMDGVRRELVSQPRYHETVETMLLMNHDFISLDSGVLAHAHARWGIDERFRKVARNLGVKQADMDSSVGVCAEFLQRVWVSADHSLAEKRRATFAMLEAVIADNHYGVAREIVARVQGIRWVGADRAERLDLRPLSARWVGALRQGVGRMLPDGGAPQPDRPQPPVSGRPAIHPLPKA